LSTLSRQLSSRALNRATLARQLLLRREALPAIDAVRHLVGLQAQVPHDPYTGLWSRLDGFRPEELSALLERREVVRAGVMRGTLHLVTADDCLVLRSLTQPVFEGQLWRHRDYSPLLRDVALEPVVEAARALLDERPRTGSELRRLLRERFPASDPAALVYGAQMRLALVQPPPRGLWRRRAQVAWTTAEAWLGRPLAAEPSVEDVLLRYLGAFGPASAADAATWSRLTGLREVFERLRPRLVTFEDERGRELFDLADAPRPDPSTPAPARFLPEYDNVLLSHDDRSRFYLEEERAAIAPEWKVGWGSVLHDGLVRAMWRRLGEDLVVRHVPLPKRAQASIAAEARRLAGSSEPRVSGSSPSRGSRSPSRNRTAAAWRA
jgi:Winged helix DNA-binding domain